jgi:hypothetical protein
MFPPACRPTSGEHCGNNPRPEHQPNHPYCILHGLDPYEINSRWASVIVSTAELDTSFCYLFSMMGLHNRCTCVCQMPIYTMTPDKKSLSIARFPILLEQNMEAAHCLGNEVASADMIKWLSCVGMILWQMSIYTMTPAKKSLSIDRFPILLKRNMEAAHCGYA